MSGARVQKGRSSGKAAANGRSKATVIADPLAYMEACPDPNIYKLVRYAKRSVHHWAHNIVGTQEEANVEQSQSPATAACSSGTGVAAGHYGLHCELPVEAKLDRLKLLTDARRHTKHYLCRKCFVQFPSYVTFNTHHEQVHEANNEFSQPVMVYARNASGNTPTTHGPLFRYPLSSGPSGSALCGGTSCSRCGEAGFGSRTQLHSHMLDCARQAKRERERQQSVCGARAPCMMDPHPVVVVTTSKASTSRRRNRQPFGRARRPATAKSAGSRRPNSSSAQPKHTAAGCKSSAAAHLNGVRKSQRALKPSVRRKALFDQ